MNVHSIQLLVLGALLGIAQSVSAQEPDTSWTRTFGGDASDVARSVLETSDGGFVLGGETFSFGAGASDAWLIRTDENGDTLWTKTYGDGGGSYESLNAVNETDDGGYIMTGRVFAGGVTDMLLIRTDENGDTLWTRTYGSFDTDSGYDVLQTPDGGFIVCGTTRSYHTGFGSSVWLFRTDADGDSLWSKTYGGSSYQEGSAVNLGPDDGFIVTGSYNDGGSQSGDVWLLRTDAQGDTLWTRRYGGEGTQQGSAVLNTSDGGFVLSASDFGATAGGLWLVRTDEDGENLWIATFDGVVDNAGSLDETADGGFILTGSTIDGELLLIRTDAGGNELWRKTLDRGDSAYGAAVRRTDDGGYIVAGNTESSGQTDIWMIRLGSESTSSDAQTATALPTAFRLDQNFPNPFNPSTTITYALQQPAVVHLAVFNVLGQEVRTLVNALQPAGEYGFRWNARDAAGGFMSSGVYLYRLNVDGVVQTRTMQLLK